MFLIRNPRAVRGLVVNHEAERAVLVAPPKPVETQVRDDVRRIPFDHLDPTWAVELRIDVLALEGQDLPFVESSRIRTLRQSQMPLAEDRRLVARILQRFGVGAHPMIHVGVDGRHPVDVTVRASEDGRARRRADRVGAVDAIEPDAFIRDAVDVRGAVHLAAVGADRVG